MCDSRDIASRLGRALQRVYDADQILLEIEVHERTIGARLAMYLQDEFPDWNVDCEYNRNLKNPKVVLEKLAYPDVVVHKRNTFINLLAIEMKGYWSEKTRDHDFRKLASLTGPEFEYELGVHIELGPDAFELKWFAEGGQIEVTA